MGGRDETARRDRTFQKPQLNKAGKWDRRRRKLEPGTFPLQDGREEQLLECAGNEPKTAGCGAQGKAARSDICC